MADLSYSDDALNIRGAFFGAKTVVYVEGDDDVLFWHEVFSQVTDEHFEVESVGGSPRLDEYIQKISDGQLIAIAARDCDFLHILGSRCSNPRVVYTYGYAIENSLYVAESVTQLARAWCKTNKLTNADCEAWLKGLATTVAPLVHLDLANATSSTGVATIGDNCGRFMTSTNSAAACPTKVATAISESAPYIPPSAITLAESTVGFEPDKVLNHIRGHFLASAIHRYITKQAKSLGRKVSISAESLYAAALSQFSSSLRTKHPHRIHYIEAARVAWHSI
jgi:Protein of unknown function (DUF4435)